MCVFGAKGEGGGQAEGVPHLIPLPVTLLHAALINCLSPAHLPTHKQKNLFHTSNMTGKAVIPPCLHTGPSTLAHTCSTLTAHPKLDG